MSASTTPGQGFTSPGQGWSNGDIAPQLFPVSHEGRLQLYGSQRRWIGLGKGWTRIGKGATEMDARHSSSQSTCNGNHLAEDAELEARTVRSLIAQLCETFHSAGWATGTGGGASIRVGGPSQNRPWRVFVAPSGVQKEDMIGDDIFELDMERNVVVPPKTPNLRQSACTPLWYIVYKHRPTAQCVIHTHSIHAQMATLLDPTETTDCLRLTHLEMLKGVGHHAYDDILEIPIIDNRPTEDLLASQLESVIQKYPKCNAVLVRRHGVYVWGDSWEQAKTQCESFDYLFQSAIQMKQMGLDPGQLPAHGTYRDSNEGPLKKRKLDGFHGLDAVDNAVDLQSNAIPILPRDGKILLLDIEGCTTSISFVKEVLFPFARKHFQAYCQQHLDKDELQELHAALIEEVEEHGGKDDPSINKSDIMQCVFYLMDRDVKSAALKNIQGQIWRLGYESGEIKGHVYSDLQPMCAWMQAHNVQVYIYSSGSVQAQQLLFRNSVQGDLLTFISGYFDIPSAGPKMEAASYSKIAQELKVDPSLIVFASDAEGELVAARQAGIGYPVMSIRPGNAKLTSVGKSFPAIYSLLQLCGE